MAGGPHRGLHASLRQIHAAIEIFNVEVQGIGVGIAGIIDSNRGIVRYSPNMPGWENINLADILEKKYRIPVCVLNDVNAACLGEWQYGAAQDRDDVFMLTVGTGVGGAAVCAGSLQFGAHGFAGEIGHMIIKHDGRKCVCGNRGCLESYVGARPMITLARKFMRSQRSSLQKYARMTPKIVAQEARKGDRVSGRVFSQIGYYLGVGITSIIHLYDPEVVIVSGGISKAGKILFDPIRKTVKERVMGGSFRDCKIVPPKLKDNAGILGAVYFARNKKQLRG